MLPIITIIWLAYYPYDTRLDFQLGSASSHLYTSCHQTFSLWNIHTGWMILNTSINYFTKALNQFLLLKSSESPVWSMSAFFWRRWRKIAYTFTFNRLTVYNPTSLEAISYSNLCGASSVLFIFIWNFSVSGIFIYLLLCSLYERNVYTS